MVILGGAVQRGKWWMDLSVRGAVHMHAQWASTKKARAGIDSLEVCWPREVFSHQHRDLREQAPLFLVFTSEASPCSCTRSRAFQH